ncbi:MAG: radical SAM protein [Candidatus Woesearchaeota archaeon]
MKLKLIFPPFEDVFKARIPFVPVGISTLFSYLKAEGMDVEQDDLNVRTAFYNQTHDSQISVFFDKRRLTDFLDGISGDLLDGACQRIMDLTQIKRYDMVGFSIIQGAQLQPALALAKKIKEDIGCKILFGGQQAARNLVEQYDFVDYAVLGEGQVPVKMLCESIEGNRSFDNIPRFVYRQSGKVFENQGNSWLGVNQSPAPDFEGLPLQMYKEMKHKFGNEYECYDMLLLPYYFMEGCTGHCFFCAPERQNLNLKPVSQVIDDLVYLKSKFRTKYFYFLNNTVNADERYLEELCKRMVSDDLDIMWSDSARLDNLDSSLLSLMKDSGCVKLAWGLEAGSQSLLAKMNKNLNLAAAERILHISNEKGIWNEANLIIGFPYETEAEFCETVSFLVRNKSIVDWINVSPFFLNRGTVMYKYPERFRIRINGSIADDSGTPIFDEIDGMDWQKRKDVVLTRGQAIVKLLNQRHDVHLTDTLYYYYGQLEEKESVRRAFEDIYKHVWFTEENPEMRQFDCAGGNQ